MQARIVRATATGTLEGIEALHDAYATTVAELRRKLSIPALEPSSVSDLVERTRGALVWIVATANGGLALRLSPDAGVQELELPQLTIAASTDWHRRLHPSTDTDDADDGHASDDVDRSGPGLEAVMLRGPLGHGAPTDSDVEKVLAELHRALGGAASWLDQPGTVLVPIGALGGLPWQSYKGHLLLHITATQATCSTSRPPTGDLVVYANPTDDLPGAVQEAEYLIQNHGADAVIGSAATLASLGTLKGCHLLHLAMHGTPEPALRFADENLDLENVHQLRHLWPDLGLIFLNCCTSGATLVEVRDEALGIPTVALTGGARSVLVALWPVDDRAASTFACAYHDYLADGATLHEALAGARSCTAKRHPHGGTHHAYQLLG